MRGQYNQNHIIIDDNNITQLNSTGSWANNNFKLSGSGQYFNKNGKSIFHITSDMNIQDISVNIASKLDLTNKSEPNVNVTIKTSFMSIKSLKNLFLSSVLPEYVPQNLLESFKNIQPPFWQKINL